MHPGQRHVQRLAITDRAGRDEGLYAVIENDQRRGIGRRQLIGDVLRTAHGLGQRWPGHRTGTVDDHGKVVRLACLLVGLDRVGCLDTDQYRQLLCDTSDKRRLERLDEDLGNVVIGHVISCSSGTIAGEWDQHKHCQAHRMSRLAMNQPMRSSSRAADC